MHAIHNYIRAIGYHPELALEKHSLASKQQDGVLLGYYHPYLKSVRIVADTDGIQVRDELAQRGYECVSVKFYIPTDKKESDCFLAYQPKPQVMRSLLVTLHKFQDTVEDMTLAYEQFGEVKFGDGDTALHEEQFKNQWHLFNASIQGD